MRGRWLLIAFASAALAAGAWLLRPMRSTPDAPRVVGTRLFEQVLDKVRSAAVEPIGDEELYRRAVAGVIEELDDPYAVLLLPGEEVPPIGGVPVATGLFLDRRDGVAVIVATVAGSPADSAGVHAGDRLLSVDSVAVDPLRLDRAVAGLEGVPGSSVTLRLGRTGTRGPLTLEVVRGPTPEPAAVMTALLPGGVGHLRVTRFVPGLADSIRRGLEGLQAQGAKSLVLDLRSTVGGELAQAVEVAELFLDQGKTLALSRGRPGGPSERFTDREASPFATMPLAVLIDAGTAGAAEVVAGAVQDHDRAAVFGARSFGRGVTRTTYQLGEGVSLQLTTSLWMTPSGRQIQRPPRPASGDSLPQPTVKSTGGRILVGGGGIAPDRLIAESERTDLALAEARRVLSRAGTPGEVILLLHGER